MRAPPILMCGALGLALTGCGIGDPYQHPAQAPPSARLSATSTSASNSTTTAVNPGEQNEGAGGPANRLTPAPGAAAVSPRAALTRFAHLYVNWSATQLPARSRQLAAICTGQAHAQALALSARATALEAHQVTNAGTVTAIAPGQGQEQGRWAVVTNELTSGTGPYLGLPATSHVTWATLTHETHGYVVSGWYPAS